ncbi:condensation domain-containing protein [Kitasatospora sp. NPDC048239]|uniref:condensation domain-containing protein n=1 Tax=Kitasatospora sp. NPDC048239 TaxID=3364046 RepID=UPI003721DE3F
MHDDERLEIRFEGLAEGIEAATWGQRTIWAPISWYAPDDHYFNIALPLELRHPVEPEAFGAALRALLERHGSLRTMYRTRPDGLLEQRLQGHGALTVRTVAATAGEPIAAAVERLAAEDRAVRFDLLGDGLPLRVSALLVDGLVAAAALTMAHIAADGTGAQVVRDDLRRLLVQQRRRPGTLPPPVPGRQPMEQAAYEAGPQATARSQAAIALWTRQLAGIPASLWPEETGPAEPERWWEGELACPRLDLASRLAAVRTGTSPSAVVLAAVGLELGARTGVGAVPLKVILGNRVSEAQRTAVGAFAQNGLVVLDTGAGEGGGAGNGGGLDESAQQAWRAQMQTSRHGHYDPTALAAAVLAEEKRRGAEMDLNALFNDHREPDRPAGPGAAAAAPEPADLDGMPAGRFGWRSRWARQDCKFFFGLAHRDGEAFATLLVDTRYVPAAEVEPFLRAVEERVVAAAG